MYNKFIHIFLVSFIFILLSFPVNAHQLSRSFSKWEINDKDVEVSFTVPARQVTLLAALEGPLASLDKLLARHLERHLKIYNSKDECNKLGEIKSSYDANGYVRGQIKFICENNGDEILIKNNSFFPVSIGHVHFARIKINDTDWQESIFTSSRPEATFSLQTGKSEQSKFEIFIDYIYLGFDHILEGYDHLAFLFAILLITFQFRKMLLSITGFTLGHSITLALASLGYIQPAGEAIEALIGFTILLVAYEALTVDEKNKYPFAFIITLLIFILALISLFTGGNINLMTWLGLVIFTFFYNILLEDRKQAERLNPLITVVFGLIHGFGFAGVLTELGLPKDGLIVGLLGFNLGVELGQILVISIVLIILFLLGKTYLARYKKLIYNLTGMSLIALGVFWFVGRSLGI
tara:strand:- start:2734 stop:3957 length:1224 start_codon:yes stop_codon:yes gene_type:complete